MGLGKVYQGSFERRVRAWFFGAGTPAARIFRVGLVLLPLAIGVAAGVPVCPTALLFGLPCPGCGLTRATLALAGGDVAAAQALNPLAVVVSPLFVGAAGFAIYRYVRGGRIDAHGWGAGWVLALGMGALTAIWLARWFGYFGGPVPV